MDYLDFRQEDFYKSIPYGELLKEDEELLWKYSQGDIMEIGTFLGRSAVLFSRKAKSVHTIDLFEKILDIVDEKNRKHYKELFRKYNHKIQVVADNLKKYGNIFVVQRTIDLFIKWNHQGVKFDVIFLDGDHSYNGVKDDFYETLPLLKDNGFIIFHDSVKNDKAPHHEVYLFLEEIKDRFLKIDSQGSTTVWRKK